MGLTLRFLRDEDGRPRVLYILDRLGICRVCGHDLIERHYADTSYHHLTAARFRQVAHSAPSGFDHECEQCGEGLGPADVRRWTVTYGFPLEPGLIQAFCRRHDAGENELDGIEVVYALSPHRELDGQMQPEWDVPDDQSVAVFPELTEGEIQVVMGRALSVKAAWRRLLRACLERRRSSLPLETLATELAPGCWAVVGPSEETVAAGLRGLKSETSGAGDPIWVEAWLADPINRLVDDGPDAWLPEAWQAQLGTSLHAVAAGDVRWAAGALDAALRRLPVATSFEVEEPKTSEGGGALNLRVGFPVGDDESLIKRLGLSALVLEALVTGAAPADWLALWIDDCLVEATRGATDG